MVINSFIKQGIQWEAIGVSSFNTLANSHFSESFFQSNETFIY
jgi:hypothetical protein